MIDTTNTYGLVIYWIDTAHLSYKRLNLYVNEFFYATVYTVYLRLVYLYPSLAAYCCMQCCSIVCTHIVIQTNRHFSPPMPSSASKRFHPTSLDGSSSFIYTLSLPPAPTLAPSKDEAHGGSNGMPAWRPWVPGLSHAVEFQGEVFETVRFIHCMICHTRQNWHLSGRYDRWCSSWCRTQITTRR